MVSAVRGTCGRGSSGGVAGVVWSPDGVNVAEERVHVTAVMAPVSVMLALRTAEIG
ncbi:hypothetical protein LV78_004154 [Actinosynnema pretiosum]|nr:hypothetical protein [Actinosynnema pretiosum]